MSATSSTGFTVTTQFPANAADVAASGNFYKAGADVTVRMTWTYDQYYTLTVNDGVTTVAYPSAQERELEWTLQHAVVNTEAAVADIYQYYDTNNTNAIRVYRKIDQSTPDLVSNINSNDVTFTYSLSAPTQLKPAPANPQNVLSWDGVNDSLDLDNGIYTFPLNSNNGAITIFEITPDASTNNSWVILSTADLPKRKILLRSTTTTHYLETNTKQVVCAVTTLCCWVTAKGSITDKILT